MFCWVVLTDHDLQELFSPLNLQFSPLQLQFSPKAKMFSPKPKQFCPLQKLFSAGPRLFSTIQKQFSLRKWDSCVQNNEATALESLNSCTSGLHCRLHEHLFRNCFLQYRIRSCFLLYKSCFYLYQTCFKLVVCCHWIHHTVGHRNPSAHEHNDCLIQ